MNVLKNINNYFFILEENEKISFSDLSWFYGGICTMLFIGSIVLF